MEKKIKTTAGVSIIEILIAMVIVSIALVTIAGVFPRMGAHGKAVNEADQARMLATEVLEGVQKLSKDRHPNDCEPAPATPACINITQGGTPIPHVPYRDFVDKLQGKPVKIGQVDYTVGWRLVNATGNNPATAICSVTWNKNNKRHVIRTTGIIMVR